jgi:predicted nucleic acid-binding protein
MPGNFFDTNVLIYLASDDARKADKAEALVRAGGMITVQVLNELAHVLRRKLKLPWAETHAFLSGVRNLLTVAPIPLETHTTGLAVAERYNLSIYDAMIVAAALEADCDVLWSEDMQNDMLINRKLRIANPFRAD